MQLDLFSTASANRADRSRIDRVSTHMCDGLARDIAYYAAQGRNYFRCDEGCRPITVQYAQFSMICADCRRECTDDSDFEETTCVYCHEAL